MTWVIASCIVFAARTFGGSSFCISYMWGFWQDGYVKAVNGLVFGSLVHDGMDQKKLPESVIHFAAALKRERRRLGLTQSHLADLSGISLATVNQVEGARRIDPEFATLEKLAKAVGSNISNLIEDGRKLVGQDFQSVRDCVGAKVRKLREERGYTKQQLGKLAGISHTYIGMVEAGASSASVDKLCALCVVFEVSLETLFQECGP